MRNLLSNTIQDVRFALRTLRKNPGFTGAALLTLALGIGANVAIYTVIDSVLLHPIPFPEPDRLVAIYQKTGRVEKASVPHLNLLDWQRQTQTFEAIAGLSFAKTDYAKKMVQTGRDVAVRDGGRRNRYVVNHRIIDVVERRFASKQEQTKGTGRKLMAVAPLRPH